MDGRGENAPLASGDLIEIHGKDTRGNRVSSVFFDVKCFSGAQKRFCSRGDGYK